MIMRYLRLLIEAYRVVFGRRSVAQWALYVLMTYVLSTVGFEGHWLIGTFTLLFCVLVMPILLLGIEREADRRERGE